MGALTFIRKIRFYLLIAGAVCLSFGIYQKYWYTDLIDNAVIAIEENQFDQQNLEQAKKSLLASEGLISYNMGVRAFRANNLKKASTHFYDVIKKAYVFYDKQLKVGGRYFYKLVLRGTDDVFGPSQGLASGAPPGT